MNLSITRLLSSCSHFFSVNFFFFFFHGGNGIGGSQYLSVYDDDEGTVGIQVLDKYYLGLMIEYIQSGG